MSGFEVPQRIAVIGGSLSGKTTWVIQNILPLFNYIHLFGKEHNLKVYKENANKYARVKYHKKIDDLEKIQGSKTVQQLVLFDDFVDTHFVGSDIARSFYSSSRHDNITVVVVAHAPNVVLTPFIKTSISMFVLCQYIPNKSFKELLEEFWFSLLAQDLISSKKIDNLDKQCRLISEKILTDLFKYEYSKLVVSPLSRKWQAIKGSKLLGSTESSSLVNSLLNKSKEHKLKAHNKEIQEDDSSDEE